MLSSSLCDYSNEYILVIATITVLNTAAVANDREKLASITNCIIEINKKQADNAKDIDIVMLIYNLIEYSDNCSKTLGSL